MSTPPKDQKTQEIDRLKLGLSNLRDLRENLEDYLAILESNTQVISKWLRDNHDAVILGYHQLNRAVSFKKDAAQATALLKGFDKNVAQFILSIENFDALGKQYFGDSNVFNTALASFQPGPPQDILTPLPVINLPPDEDLYAPMHQAQKTKQETQAAKKQSGGVSSWFKSAEQKAAEKAAVEIEALVSGWQSTRQQLLDVQNEGFYFVDSFMDWIEEGFSPKTADVELERIQRRFENPAYIVSCAQRDFDAAQHVEGGKILQKARHYGELASLLDNQNIPAFIQKLPLILPLKETDESAWLHRSLLADFKTTGLLQYALTDVKNPWHACDLMESILGIYSQKKKSISLKNANDLLATTIARVIDPQNPLPARALGLALNAIKSDGKDFNQTLIQSQAFNIIATSLAHDPAKLKECLTYLNKSLSPALDIAGPFISLGDAIQNRNYDEAKPLLAAFAQGGRARNILALWNLCYPQTPFMPALAACAQGDSEKLSDLIAISLNAGITDDLHVSLNEDFTKFSSFIENHVMPDLDSFAPDVLKRLIATALHKNGKESYRQCLSAGYPDTTDQGFHWLSRIVADTRLSDNKKGALLGALLSPFTDDITTSAILHDSAKNTPDQNAARVLARLEKQFVGQSLRMSPADVLINTHRIGSAWHGQRGVCFVVDGKDFEIPGTLAAQKGRDTLALLQRRTNMIAEKTGLFDPNNCDLVTLQPRKSSLHWSSAFMEFEPPQGVLNTFTQNPGWLKEAIGDAERYFKIDSLALIEENDDGSFTLVNKGGAVEQVSSDIHYSMPPTHIKCGKAWINPALISLFSLNEDTGTVGLRIESESFQAFAKDAFPDSSFYYIDGISKQEIRELRDILEKDTDCLEAGKDLSDVYLNMKALGFLVPFDRASPSGHPISGFYAKAAGQAQHSEIVFDKHIRDEICDILLAKSPRDYFTLSRKDGKSEELEIASKPEAFRNIYYHTREKGLYFMGPSSEYFIPFPQDQALKLLQRLCDDHGYMPLIKNAEGPFDTVRKEDIVSLSYDTQDGELVVRIPERVLTSPMSVESAVKIIDELDKEDYKARCALPGYTPQIKDIESSVRANMTPVHVEPSRVALRSEQPAGVLFEELCDDALAQSKRKTKLGRPVAEDFEAAVREIVGQKTKQPAAKKTPGPKFKN